jgi:hypothetical protein
VNSSGQDTKAYRVEAQVAEFRKARASKAQPSVNQFDVAPLQRKVHNFFVLLHLDSGSEGHKGRRLQHGRRRRQEWQASAVTAWEASVHLHFLSSARLGLRTMMLHVEYTM